MSIKKIRKRNYARAGLLRQNNHRAIKWREAAALQIRLFSEL
jgi:hypothetical protein